MKGVHHLADQSRTSMKLELERLTAENRHLRQQIGLLEQRVAQAQANAADAWKWARSLRGTSKC